MIQSNSCETIRRPALMNTAIALRLGGLAAIAFFGIESTRWAVSHPELSTFATAVIVGSSLAVGGFAIFAARDALHRMSFEAHKEKSFHWVDARTLSIAKQLAKVTAPRGST